MPRPVACTIIANNYLAFARVFAASFREHHPDGEVHVLVVDDADPPREAPSEPFTRHTVEQLQIPGFHNLAFRYSLLELSTALKPSFLAYLLRSLGVPGVAYFDPDILVTADLGPVYGELTAHDLLLTPHITAPLEDERVPGEHDILVSGAYNLGFVGVAAGERSFAFLDWWQRRLHFECLHDVGRGLFVDQRWMDLAPAFIPRTRILHDPGLNVAYWNLPHRRLEHREGAWRVDGRPLRFFHFSGFDPLQPRRLSRFQNRYDFADRPDVEPLFAQYARLVLAAGHEQLSKTPYRFSRFANGVAVPEFARQALQGADPYGRRWPDPFATDGPDSYFEWLRAPVWADRQPALPRLALLLWDRRPDLQARFPRPDGADRVAFGDWLVSSASREGIDFAFVAAVAEDLGRLGAGPVAAKREAAAVERLLAMPGDEGALLTGETRALAPDLVAWLTTDAGFEPGRRPHIPHFALLLYRRRTDLRRVFPDPLGRDREAFALWLCTSGRLEHGLPMALLAPTLRTLAWRRRLYASLWWRRRAMERRRGEVVRTPPPAAGAAPDPGPAARRESVAPRPGVNVVGWADAPTGVGEACRGTVRALEHAGIPGTLRNLGDGSAEDLQRALRSPGELPFDTILYHVNADMMETVCRQLPRGLTAGRRAIGYWFWELSYLPLEFAPAFRYVDEVWAPSRFCLEAFGTLAPVPIRWMPPHVAPPAAPPLDRAGLGIDPGRVLFLSAFDVLSVPARKNPFGMLSAFAEVAGRGAAPVHLVLKVTHAAADAALVAELRERSRGLPVTLLVEPMTRSRFEALLATCDAYVSLHRLEGLGLPLIEALYLAKPVVATGYGGVLDYLDEATGFVVRHRLAALAEPHPPYPAGSVWADPDLEHAAALLLEVAADPPRAAARGRAGRERVTALYGAAAVGSRFRAALERGTPAAVAPGAG
jgi:glycosyltransferase involved in cell wall biosynthesis